MLFPRAYSAWIDQRTRQDPKFRGALLSLDEGDSDPSRFLLYLAARVPIRRELEALRLIAVVLSNLEIAVAFPRRRTVFYY